MGMGSSSVVWCLVLGLLVIVVANAEVEEATVVLPTAAAGVLAPGHPSDWCLCHGSWRPCEVCSGIGAVITRRPKKEGGATGAQIGIDHHPMCRCSGAWIPCEYCRRIGAKSQAAIARGSTKAEEGAREALITAAVEGQTKTTAWYDCDDYCSEEEPTANHADCVYRCQNAPRRQASSITK